MGLGGCAAPQAPNGTIHNAVGCFPSLLGDPVSPIHGDNATSAGCVDGIGSSLTASSTVKTKKIMYDLLDNEEFDREEIPTYEDVARLFPRPGAFRPLVLIGPPGVGRNELKRRVMALECERYKATIPRELLLAFTMINK